MRIPQSGLRIDSPSFPLLQALISYWGTTDADGNVGGTTIRCGALALEPSYANHALKILSGPAAGQTRDISTHPAGTDTITVSDAFSNVAGAAQQITAGTCFAVLSSTPTVAEVAAVLAAIATLQTDVDDLQTSRNRQLFSMDFWSDLREEVAVTGAQSTIALPTVTVADLPGGATIVRAIAMFKFRIVENTNVGANKLDAAAALPVQVDDAGATGYVTAIDFVDDAFSLAASTREGGDVIIGDNDIAARVDGNDIYSVRWLNAKADLANLQFNDIQIGLRIWYSV